jgi:ribulose-phosphate 3-epimerase
MLRPAASWIDDLPSGRVIAEFSVWSADLLRLGDELTRIGPYADVLHIDVADSHFAPALLFFPDLVAAIRQATRLPIHVHLMAADRVVLSQIDQFAEAGGDLISIHLENAAVVDAALDRLQAKGVAAGMVAKVETPIAGVSRFLPRLRFLTLLGTAVGLKGQPLDSAACDRLREAKRLIAESGAEHRIVLAADGGIREQTVPDLRAAGAESLVLGSLAFRAQELAALMEWLRAI